MKAATQATTEDSQNMMIRPHWTTCTQWQSSMDQILAEKQLRKDLIVNAMVNLPPQTHLEHQDPLNSINHFFNLERVELASKVVNRDAKPGIDGIDLIEYLAQADLIALVKAIRSRTYEHQLLRWTLIDKNGGGKRDLGIPTFEDRIVQRTWTFIAEPIFERKFLDCSYGYRQDRSCHMALEEIAREVINRQSVWVIDADFRKYFDSVPHNKLIELIRLHITDPVFLYFINTTLRVSRLPGTESDPIPCGLPQGGIISPLLANLYAHHVLDTYFEEVIKPRLAGWGRLFRYADDFIVLCGSEEDARLALRLIDERVTEFGLSLHPDKTFLRNLTNPTMHPLASSEELRGITFLGYELAWKRSGDKSWEFKGKTAPGRRAKALAQWDKWLKDFRREQITQGSSGISPKQIDHLLNSAVSHIQGFNSYYLVEGNQGELARYEEQVRGAGARYWNRYIDPHQEGSNPFEDDREWLWHNIKMRKLTELSGKPSNSAFTSEKPLRGKEAAWDR